jgi:CRISPR-associated protein Csh2
MSIEKNSEILFLYDAKMTNPNGDMDNENKPRMDYDTNTNLVSDVRLKRYIRDYLELGLGKEIFITENAKDSKDRAKQLGEANKTYTDLIDVQLFGAVFAAEGGNDHLTGPVQFNWGYSLNPVEINESSTITSSFSGGEGVGKDFRVKYSLIAFNGSINGNISESTKLNDETVKIFDKAMIQALPFNRTRSKTGQAPRLYLRVETDKSTFLKDLREYVKINYKTDDYKVRSIEDLTLDLSELKTYLESKGDKITAIKYWIDDKMVIENCESIESYLKIGNAIPEKMKD